MCNGNAWTQGLYKSGSELEKTWIQWYDIIIIATDTEMQSKSADTALYFCMSNELIEVKFPP